MTRRQLEDLFLDYCEETLAPERRQELEAALAKDPELHRSLSEYQSLMNIERKISSESHEPSFSVDTKVLARIREQEEHAGTGPFRKIICLLGGTGRDPSPLRAQDRNGLLWETISRLYMEITANHKRIIASAATLATLVLVYQLALDTQREFKAKDPLLPRTVNEVATQPIPPAESSVHVPGKLGTSSSPNFGEAAKKDESKVKLMNPNASFEDFVTIFIPKNSSPEEVGRRKAILAERQRYEKNQNEQLSQILREHLNRLQQLESNEAVTGPKLAGKKLRNDVFNSAGQKTESAQQFTADSLRPPFIGGSGGTSVYPANPSSEGYAAYEENPRIRVADEPLSTFGVDVDTASYSNARRFLSTGQLPPTDSVRIEEFVNYFDYNYPHQTEKPFTLSYEIAPSPLEKDRLLLKLGIKARDAAQGENPWNLVFLVDVSGSMAEENKLPLVKRSLTLLAQKMRPQDRIAIVTYAGSAGLVLDSTLGSERARITSAIENLSPGGSTYGSAGINLAYEIAQQHMIKGGVNRVVLATDGDFNVGVTSPDQLVGLIEEKRKSGVTLTTLGFGTGNLQDGKMQQLADKGNGNYFYIDSFKEARKVLGTQLAGTMEVVAKDVKLQIEFNPQHVAQYRLIGYEKRKLRKEDFNNDAIDAGEIGSGHTVTALYEIIPANSELAKQFSTDSRYQQLAPEKKVETSSQFAAELAFLKIRFKKPDGDNSELLQFPIEQAHVLKEVSATSQDFRFAAAVSYFGHLLRNSQFKGNYSFADIASLAAGARGEDTFGYRQEFIELVKNAQALGQDPRVKIPVLRNQE